MGHVCGHFSIILMNFGRILHIFSFSCIILVNFGRTLHNFGLPLHILFNVAINPLKKKITPAKNYNMTVKMAKMDTNWPKNGQKLAQKRTKTTTKK